MTIISGKEPPRASTAFVKRSERYATRSSTVLKGCTEGYVVAFLSWQSRERRKNITISSHRWDIPRENLVAPDIDANRSTSESGIVSKRSNATTFMDIITSYIMQTLYVAYHWHLEGTRGQRAFHSHHQIVSTCQPIRLDL